MEERHEILTFPHNLKLHVFMHAIGSVSRHWHRSIELLFLIKGCADLKVDERAFTMSEGDVTLINSNSIHELISQEGAVFIAVQIKPDMFDSLAQDNMTPEFDCVSALSQDQPRFDCLRMCISRMLLENVRHCPGTDFRNYGLGYWLLGQLVENFRIPVSDLTKTRQKYTRRLNDIVDYIETHYAENISLAHLAKDQNLSVPYLSGFFTKYMGVKFSQYCNDIRLNHALRELLDTDHTVERVATNNGFAEPHHFIRVFKQKFGSTPNAYRKNFHSKKNTGSVPAGINYLSLEPSNYFGLLKKYASSRSLLSETTTVLSTEQLPVPSVNVTAVRKTLRHTFKNVITVGRAHDLLKDEIRNMLRDIQSVVGFRHIKFHGILGDDMMVCSRAADGSLEFQFQMVDSAIEFLLSIGLKPMIQLSFMPAALASDSEKTIFHNPFNTSLPKDMGEWNLLIENFTRHLLSRFGTPEVSSWLFTVWCEPDTPPGMFGFKNRSDFFELYANTFRTVKKVCPDIKFGTPSVLYMRHTGEPRWIKDFFQFLHDSGLSPDYINIHYYADILKGSDVDWCFARTPSSMLPRKTDDFSDFITDVKGLFVSLGFGDKPLYLTEWNLTLSHRNLVSDTCFKSCYIMKNLLENYDRLESFGYWSLTDLLEETLLPDSAHIFHGGLGIYTMSGVRKSVFYSFDFASRLGDELLSCGDGWFVTGGKNGSIQIITYNYVHYGELFASGDALGITELDRCAPFDMSRALRFSIPLTHLKPGNYILAERFVNCAYGSAFDVWVRTGGLPISSEDAKDFTGCCVPALRSKRLNIPSGTYTYTPTLEPLEIRFAEIIPET